MRIEESLVQINEKQSHTLHAQLFDVNMRLFDSNKAYKGIIFSIVKYMKRILDTKFSNYPILRGISGANVGIPYNIIVIKKEDGSHLVMLNPNIVEYSEQTKVIKSNCGSINLEKPVKVRRHKSIVVTYNGLNGSDNTECFQDKDYAYTIQHEVDHNRGVTILKMNQSFMSKQF